MFSKRSPHSAKVKRTNSPPEYLSPPVTPTNRGQGMPILSAASSSNCVDDSRTHGSERIVVIAAAMAQFLISLVLVIIDEDIFCSINCLHGDLLRQLSAKFLTNC